MRHTYIRFSSLTSSVSTSGGTVAAALGARVLLADIETPALIIEDGAIFQGNCVMGDKKGASVTNIAAKA